MNQQQILIEAYAKKNPGCIKGLTFRQRLMSFAFLIIFGIILIFLSFFILFFSSKEKKVPAFALLYTIGNITTILSTGILIGYQRQCRNMTHKNRLCATLTFLISMILTLVFVFTLKGPKQRLLTLLSLMFQIASFIWYVLSYIPYARQCCKKSSAYLLSNNQLN